MKEKKAFTLIELLVVISIIAMLMAILMPALKMVKLQGQELVCRSNLRQWGVFFSLYTQDNGGYFPEGHTQNKMWMDLLETYHHRDYDIFCCPTAKAPWTEGGKFPFAAWGITGGQERHNVFTAGDFGSYGMNGWLCNPPPDVEQYSGHNTDWNWRHANVQPASNIPMFMGCSWPNGRPEVKNTAPVYDGDASVSSNDPMKRFCMNRHRGFAQGIFLDQSLKKYGMKEPWYFKWHRKFDLTAEKPVWPEWIKRLEYKYQ